MVREAEEYAEEDKAVKDRIDARNSLESYLYNMKNLLDDEEKGVSEKISEADKEVRPLCVILCVLRGRAVMSSHDLFVVGFFFSSRFVFFLSARGNGLNSKNGRETSKSLLCDMICAVYKLSCKKKEKKVGTNIS